LSRLCVRIGLVLFTRIDHVGVAVRNLADAIGWYETTYGLTVFHTEINEAQGVHEAMLRVGDAHADPSASSWPTAARGCTTSGTGSST
jgi:catechol 2,3-dioxygenase-like lactoylglutathione lyase family enzyme